MGCVCKLSLLCSHWDLDGTEELTVLHTRDVSYQVVLEGEGSFDAKLQGIPENLLGSKVSLKKMNYLYRPTPTENGDWCL